MENATSHIEILLDDELAALFREGFDPESVDQLGYDLRLGNRVGHVTTGERKNLTEGQESIIFPGETIIVCSEEILDLPTEVFALGSPKMSLLIKGLWAHGGKTDFGFNSHLTLGFQNVGSEPITIKRGQKIFHLSFFRVHNKETNRYAGGGPDWPTLNDSPLEKAFVSFDDETLNKIKNIDGLKIYRVCKQLQRINNKINLWYYIPVTALVLIFTSQTLTSFNIMSEGMSKMIIFWSNLIGMVSGFITIVKFLIDRYRARYNE